MKFEWEHLEDETTPHITTHRAKVFGGWLVRTDEFFRDDLFGCQSEALVFVPDPKYLWSLEKEKDPLDILICDFEIDNQWFVVRTVRCLNAEGTQTMKELLSWCEHELLKIPNFGLRSFRHTKDLLRMAGLQLGSYPTLKLENGYTKCRECRTKS